MTIFHNEAGVSRPQISSVAARNAIDTITLDPIDLPPGSPVSAPFEGTLERVMFEASLQVTCAPNFFGADCNTPCEHRNDSLGHFTCDPVNGTRICLEGHQNVESNCTECELRPGCCETVANN